MTTLFSEEQPIGPTVTSTAGAQGGFWSSDPTICHTWLFRKDPKPFERKMNKLLHGHKKTQGDVSLEEEKYQHDVLEKALTDYGAEPLTGYWVDVTVQGRDNNSILLTGLDIAVEEHRKEIPGTLVDINSGCGAGAPPRIYVVDLDAKHPRPTLSKEDPHTGEMKPDKDGTPFPYKVNSSEPEVLHLIATTDSYATWTAELHWVSKGRKGSTVIDNKGKPFSSYDRSKMARVEYSLFDRALTRY
ncbi:hypothetical protein [Streptomyces sp. NPDC013187]|uniref:hypothetical protein n=1 Tax=Streptomyces sp. NPDC013187 TaxID=3364865 RepID=UPI0036968473